MTERREISATCTRMIGCGLPRGHFGPCVPPPARRSIKRSALETLKAELSYKYAEDLQAREALTEADRASMCIGFEHGLAWLLRTLEAAGVKVSDDE